MARKVNRTIKYRTLECLKKCLNVCENGDKIPGYYAKYFGRAKRVPISDKKTRAAAYIFKRFLKGRQSGPSLKNRLEETLEPCNIVERNQGLAYSNCPCKIIMDRLNFETKESLFIKMDSC